MEPSDLLRLIADSFEKLGLDYFVTGAMASIAFGEPRLTNDIDIVASLTEADIPRLKACFPETDFYFDEEAAKKAVETSFQFNIIHPGSGFKIDVMVGKKDDFDKSRFQRIRRIMALSDRAVNFASPEDVIIKKMQYYSEGGSEKHLRDIAGMMIISRDLIDFSYISEWARKLKLEEIWIKIQTRAAAK